MKEICIENPIIIGGLHIKIGNMKIEIEEVHKSNFGGRNSKDVEINSMGKNFIDFCYDHGLLIANGMSKGGECGEFTFVSTVGASVNGNLAQSSYKH